MSNHNYSQYSKKHDNAKTTVKDEALEAMVIEVDSISEAVEIKMESVEPKVEAPKYESVKPAAPKPAVGIVVNCSKLNVRSKPAIDADVLVVLDAGNEVKIDIGRSTSDWFKITTATGVDGFCMRKFVKR